MSVLVMTAFFDRKLVVDYECMLTKQISLIQIDEGTLFIKLSDNLGTL